MQENDIPKCPDCKKPGRFVENSGYECITKGCQQSFFWHIGEAESPLEKITKERDELLKLAEAMAQKIEYDHDNKPRAFPLAWGITTSLEVFRAKYPKQP